MSSEREWTVAEKAALAVDGLLDKLGELRAAEDCEPAGDVYRALVNFYDARDEVFKLIPGCEELIVGDPTEELAEFVDENSDDLFYEWREDAVQPDELYITEKTKKLYEEYLKG